MKILKGTGIVIVLILAIIFITPLFLSSTFNVQRSTVINAKPEAVFAEVNGFKKWESWSPWLEGDKTIVNTYSGPETGVGSKVSWTSQNSGDGTMETMEVVPNQQITNQVTFSDFKPMAALFTFEAVPEGTKVVWADTGSVGYIGRWMTVMADKMMGPDFEKGLANLKKHVEGLPMPEPAMVDSTIIATPQ